MKGKPSKKSKKPRSTRPKLSAVSKVRGESPRAKLERLLGKKLLKGEIPVMRPGDIPTCPVPPSHVTSFDDCCKDYVAGKISDAEVVSRVVNMVKAMKKPPEPQSQPDSNQAGTGGE